MRLLTASARRRHAMFGPQPKLRILYWLTMCKMADHLIKMVLCHKTEEMVVETYSPMAAACSCDLVISLSSQIETR